MNSFCLRIKLIAIPSVAHRVFGSEFPMRTVISQLGGTREKLIERGARTQCPVGYILRRTQSFQIAEEQVLAWVRLVPNTVLAATSQSRCVYFTCASPEMPVMRSST